MIVKTQLVFRDPECSRFAFLSFCIQGTKNVWMQQRWGAPLERDYHECRGVCFLIPAFRVNGTTPVHFCGRAQIVLLHALHSGVLVLRCRQQSVKFLFVGRCFFEELVRFANLEQ